METEISDDQPVKKSVLWAIDPFETDVLPDRASVERLLNWIRQELRLQDLDSRLLKY